MLKWGHIDNRTAFTGPNTFQPLKSGHLANQDTFFCPKSVYCNPPPSHTHTHSTSMMVRETATTGEDFITSRTLNVWKWPVASDPHLQGLYLLASTSKSHPSTMIVHIQWNASNQDSLKWGHLNIQDTFSRPKCNVCVQFNPWNQDTSLIRTPH